MASLLLPPHPMEVMYSAFICLSICPSVCEQRNSKTYSWIFFKFSHVVKIYLSKSSSLNLVGLTGLIFKLLTKISLCISIASHHHYCSQEMLTLIFSSLFSDRSWLKIFSSMHIAQHLHLYKFSRRATFLRWSSWGDLVVCDAIQT